MSDQESRVLLIEDDPTSAAATTELLDDLGLPWELCTDGRSGLERALSENFALVISDLGLPKLGGMELCRKLREQKPNQAILVLTAEQDEMKAVLALELGADEYVRKPFSSMELRARIRAVLRRGGRTLAANPAEAQAENRKLHFGELTLDLDACQALINDKIVALTASEYLILVYLAGSPTRVISRDEIIEAIWKDSPSVYEINVRTHVSRMRSKLKAAGASREFVSTQHGFGYRFNLE